MKNIKSLRMKYNKKSLDLGKIGRITLESDLDNATKEAMVQDLLAEGGVDIADQADIKWFIQRANEGIYLTTLLRGLTVEKVKNVIPIHVRHICSQLEPIMGIIPLHEIELRLKKFLNDRGAYFSPSVLAYIGQQVRFELGMEL